MGWLGERKRAWNAARIESAERRVKQEYLRHPTMSMVKRSLRGELPAHPSLERVVGEILDAHDNVFAYAMASVGSRDAELLESSLTVEPLEMSCLSAVCRPESEELWSLVMREAVARDLRVGRFIAQLRK